MLLFRSLACIC